MRERKRPKAITIREHLLHNNLLILKARLKCRTLEKTVQYLYNFYETFKEQQAEGTVNIQEIIRDLKDIRHILHPTHVEDMIKKYEGIKNGEA